MVLGTRPKAGIKETGEAVTRPTPRDKASGCGTAEEGARQAKPRAVSEPRAARPPLPRRARSPLPSPRSPQNVRGGARRSRKSKPGRGGQTRPGSPGHRHTAHPRRPPAAPRSKAPQTAARPRGPRRRGEGSRAVGMGVTLSFRCCQVTARPRPRPRPCPGVPAAHLLPDLCSPKPCPPRPPPLRPPTEPGPARARTAPREPGTPPPPRAPHDPRLPGIPEMGCPPPGRGKARGSAAGTGLWGGRSRGEPRAPHSPQLLRRGVGSSARGLLSCRTGARA